MNEIRLLIADKETDVRTTIKTHASMEGFICDEAADGIGAIKLFRRNEYSMILLDAGLPDLDSWSVCRQIRKVSDVPVIVLSRQNEEEEKLSYFSAGIDDFMVKPVSYRELIARVHVFLRRSTSNAGFSPRRIVFGGLCIDIVSRTVYIDGESIVLTPREYKLLLYLAQNPHKALSREMILNEVWGEDFFGTDRTVDTHIKTLRENIKPYQSFISTVWGFGYIFRA